MTFAVRWRCQKGTRTEDNRDHAGIGFRDNSLLAIVLDGSTRGRTSGEFAEAIAHQMVDWFVTADDAQTAQTLIARLRATHAELADDFRGDSASYALLYAQSTGPALVLHAGDCLVGRSTTNGAIDWLLRPHSLANALVSGPLEALTHDPARHFLTRSFRTRAFHLPDENLIDFDGRPLLLATDGFWADLDTESQIAFANGTPQPVEGEHDDKGLLSLFRSRSDGGGVVLDQDSTANFYLRTA